MSILTNPRFRAACATVLRKSTEYMDAFGLDDDNLPALRLNLSQELGHPLGDGLWDLLELIGEARRIANDTAPLDVPVKDPDYPAVKAEARAALEDVILACVIGLIGHHYLEHKAAA